MIRPPGDSVDSPKSKPGDVQEPSRIVPLVIGSAMLMQTMNATLLSNALPTMAVALRVDPLRLNLAITVYLVAAAVFLPLSGWVADRLGGKRVFLASMVLFGLSAAACGLSLNIWQLIFARFVQGIAAAMMMPVGRLVLLRTLPKHQIVSALSIIMIPALLGPMLGPVMGGFIVTYWSWRWVFFISIPLAVAGVFLVWRFVPEVESREVGPFDWIGLFLIAAGLTAIITAFETVGRSGVATLMAAVLFVAGVVAMWFYARHAARHAHALLDLSVFRVPTFRAAVYGAAFMRVSLVATPFLLAILLQIGFHMSPLRAGLMTLMTSIGVLLMRVTVPPMLHRLGFRPVLLVVSVVGSLCMVGYGFFTATTPHWIMMAALFAGGFFRSLQLTAFSGLAFADIEQDHMSSASTVSSLAQQVVQAVGVSFAAMLLHLLTLRFGQSEMTAASISPAFWILGTISLLAILFVIPLPRDAGAALHPPQRGARPAPEEPPE